MHHIAVVGGVIGEMLRDVIEEDIRASREDPKLVAMRWKERALALAAEPPRAPMPGRPRGTAATIEETEMSREFLRISTEARTNEVESYFEQWFQLPRSSSGGERAN